MLQEKLHAVHFVSSTLHLNFLLGRPIFISSRKIEFYPVAVLIFIFHNISMGN
jgi:hypothetical protein